MIFVLMILRKNWKPLARYLLVFCFDEFPFNLNSLMILSNSQKLRDEEGKKLGLKSSEKSSDSKDTDVKMTEAEVI